MLLALAAPVLGLKTSGTIPSLPTDEPAMVAARDIEQTFPGAPESVSLVATKPDEVERVAERFGDEAEITRGDGAALITVPLREESQVQTLRDELPDARARDRGGRRASSTSPTACARRRRW